MQIHTADFITSATGLAACPAWNHPEFAVIGRSNVGKSSLVNLLVNRNSLAKVSAIPGKTRALNFYLINSQWAMVDLPGYGYAKTTRAEKFDFNELAGDYLEKRQNLRRVFVLIDSRLEPQRIDLDFLEWLIGARVPFSLVFTKTDKQSPTKTHAAVAAFRHALANRVASDPEWMLTSATTRHGRPDVLRCIARELAV